MTNHKTKRITFRVEDRLYEFLEEFSKASRTEISALCRNVITSYFMSYLLGELQPKGLQDRFMKKYGKTRKRSGYEKSNQKRKGK